jgi:hypothetical protein
MRGNWPYRQFQMGTSNPFPEGIASRLNEASVTMENVPRPFTAWQRQPGSNFGGLGVGSPMGFFLVSYYTAPDAIGQQCNAELYLRGVETGGAPEQIADELRSDPRHEQGAKQDAEMNKPYLMLDDAIEHEDDPVLQLKVKLEMKEKAPSEHMWRKFATQQQAIADASRFNIVSDSFSFLTGNTDLSSGEVKLQDLLDRFSEGYSCNWGRNGTTLEFRNRDWFRKRSAQLPDEWIERWRQMLLKNGTLTLDQFAQLATLSFEQWEESIFTDPVLDCCGEVGNGGWNVIHNQALLGLYLRLGHDQCDMLFSADGLRLAALAPDQQQAAADMLGYRYKAFFDMLDNYLNGGGEGMVIKASSVNEKDGRTAYEFVATDQNGGRAEWRVGMPIYEAPKKETPPIEQRK